MQKDIQISLFKIKFFWKDYQFWRRWAFVVGHRKIETIFHLQSSFQRTSTSLVSTAKEIQPLLFISIKIFRKSLNISIVVFFGFNLIDFRNVILINFVLKTTTTPEPSQHSSYVIHIDRKTSDHSRTILKESGLCCQQRAFSVEFVFHVWKKIQFRSQQKFSMQNISLQNPLLTRIRVYDCVAFDFNQP